MGETETDRVKREVLGIGERQKHHTRKATPLKSHAKAPDTHHRLYRFLRSRVGTGVLGSNR